MLACGNKTGWRMDWDKLRIFHAVADQGSLDVYKRQALNSTALLIDQNRGITTNAISQIMRQAAQLLWRFDVPGEDDKTEGLIFAKEISLLRRQNRPFAAKDLSLIHI